MVCDATIAVNGLFVMVVVTAVDAVVHVPVTEICHEAKKLLPVLVHFPEYVAPPVPFTTVRFEKLGVQVPEAKIVVS
jgi:hypothetical protein